MMQATGTAAAFLASLSWPLAAAVTLKAVCIREPDLVICNTVTHTVWYTWRSLDDVQYMEHILDDVLMERSLGDVLV